MDPTITTIEDLRRIAKRRVPRMFYDYADSGSWTEGTYGRTRTISPRSSSAAVAVDMTDRSLATIMAGQRVTMPVALAPTGMTGMQHADGEILAARAAEAAGVPFTLSTMSICSIEDVAEAVSAPFWFQLYFMRDGPSTTADRPGGAAGCSALVLTLDLQILGSATRTSATASRPAADDARDGVRPPDQPRWCLGMARTQRRTFRNIVGHVEGVADTRSISAWTSQQFDPRLDWSDVARIRDRWKGPLILKGILDTEDAEMAVATGAEALIVSNHGGAPARRRALLDRRAAGDRRGRRLADRGADGRGIRSGQDVLKAIALGAKGVFIGRPFLYGLGAGGEAGVARCLEIIRKELDMTMALCGHRNLSTSTARSCRRRTGRAGRPPQFRTNTLSEMTWSTAGPCRGFSIRRFR